MATMGTTELKKLSTKAAPKIRDRKDFTFSNGFNFGMGLSAAFFIFSVVIVPVLVCSGLTFLSMIGVTLGELIGR